MAVRAQYINQYLPVTVPGYETQPGVTVATRLRTPYDPQGVHVGDFLLNSDLAQSVGYNTNVAGFANSPGSGYIETNPSVTINSDWTRDRLGAAFTTDSKKYFSTPLQDTNDWTATLGGGYTIGREQLVAGYSHLSLHEQPNEIGTPLSATPIPYTVDDARIYYTFDQGRFSFIPRVDVQLYQYGNASLVNVPGVPTFNDCGAATGGSTTTTATGLVPVSQKCDNRVVSTGSVETRYALTDRNSAVFVVEGVNSRYMNVPAGQPTSNSQSLLALGGFDYQADGPWRLHGAVRDRAPHVHCVAVPVAHRTDRRGDSRVDADRPDDRHRPAVPDDRGSQRSRHIRLHVHDRQRDGRPRVSAQRPCCRPRRSSSRRTTCRATRPRPATRSGPARNGC